MSAQAGRQAGRLAALYRHPVKGFTPERLAAVELTAGQVFPGDRLYAVERGDSGFDPQAPRHVSKQRFAVLANHPRLARAVTAYDDDTAVLTVRRPDGPTLSADLTTADGRARFAALLQELLGEDEPQPLRVLAAPPGFRFTDDAEGFVSLLNLDSVRDLAERLGRPVDPLRFRANLHVEGWPAWRELELPAGAELQVGEATLQVIEPITRCIATHVDPTTGERDMDMLGALRRHYGHMLCGLYLRVLKGGGVREGDAAPCPVSPAPESAPCPSPSSKPGPPRATA
jgi:uncharacterized protein YcbX